MGSYYQISSNNHPQYSIPNQTFELVEDTPVAYVFLDLDADAGLAMKTILKSQINRKGYVFTEVPEVQHI